MPRTRAYVAPDEQYRLQKLAALNSRRAKASAASRKANKQAQADADRAKYNELSAREKRELAAGVELKHREEALPAGNDDAVATESTFKLTKKQQEAQDLIAEAFRYVMLVGGSRSGKTFLFVRAVALRAIKAANSRHGIFRFRLNACRASVYGDTFKKVMRICFPSVEWEYHSLDSYVTLSNGSEIWFAGLDDKDRVEKILGMEFATIYCNECSQIPWGSVEVLLTRLAQKVNNLLNRFFCDLNPTTKKHWTYKLFVMKVDPMSGDALSEEAAGQYAWLRVNPVDNVENLDKEYLKSLSRQSRRTRRRFMDGEYLDAIDNALWTPELIEKCRVDDKPFNFERLVVAVDPSGARGEEDERSDEIGICVGGLFKGRAYILADATMKGKPEAWGMTTVSKYRAYLADCVVGEKNFGGDMVRATIHAIDNSVKFKPVTAARGKVVRAEPVSAFYEADRVRHVGEFKELEDEMVNFTTDGYKGDRSPNRTDALVWLITELLGGASMTGILDYMRESAGGKDPDRPSSPARPDPLVAKVKVNIPTPIEKPTEYVIVNGVSVIKRTGWGYGN